MSLSGATFSFPSTGIYRITVQHDWYQPSGSDRAIQMSVRLSNTDFSGDSPQKVYTYGSTGGVGGYNNHGTNHCTYVVKISNTSTERIQFWTHKVNSTTVTTSNTYVDFERIADSWKYQRLICLIQIIFSYRLEQFFIHLWQRFHI